MDHPPEDGSYRLQLMLLRGRVENSRGSYRILAVLFGLLAVLTLMDKQRAEYWPFLLASGLMSFAAMLCYRNVQNRPRFWTVLSAMTWSVFFGACVLSALIAMVTGLLSGDLELSELLVEYTYRDFFGLILGLALGANLHERVVRREEAALIEEHREEWDAYMAGRSMASVKRRGRKPNFSR